MMMMMMMMMSDDNIYVYIYILVISSCEVKDASQNSQRFCISVYGKFLAIDASTGQRQASAHSHLPAPKRPNTVLRNCLKA